jgi:transposase
MKVEILNGAERRRRWSEEEKRRITEESFAAGVKVIDVARKHGVSRELLFGWRKEARVEVCPASIKVRTARQSG